MFYPVAFYMLFSRSIPTNVTNGRLIYENRCIKCHSVNPTRNGSIGPELFTTPLEVFKTKLKTGTYPKDYVPKRKTKIMPKFPDLTGKEELLYNYVRSFKND